jgi:hypothetical protein
MRVRLTRTAIAAPALFAAALFAGVVSAQETPARFTVDVSVMRGGTEIAAGRTMVLEGGQAEITLTGADGQYLFTADLQPEQGDGDESRLILEAYLNHNGVDMANPRLVVGRTGRAVMQMGSRAEDAATLSDGVEISLTPLP